MSLNDTNSDASMKDISHALLSPPTKQPLNGPWRGFRLNGIPVTAVALALACSAFSCLARQAPGERQAPFRLQPGETATLATYYEIDARHCKALASPIVSIAQQPGVAALYLARTRGVRNGPGRCGALEVPLVHVMARAGAAAGQGAYSWTTRFQHQTEVAKANGVLTVAPPTRR